MPLEFHRYLIDAQDMRARADYGIDTGISSDDATEQIPIAEQFIELTKYLL